VAVGENEMGLKQVLHVQGAWVVVRNTDLIHSAGCYRGARDVPVTETRSWLPTGR
jgi:hypothetical protein